jgi:hypothetical protein
VRDAAQQILMRLSDQNFMSLRRQYPGNSEQAAKSIEAAARKWWVAAKRKGERRWLIDHVSRGQITWATESAATRLVKMYPDDALSAIRKAVRACKDELSRAMFIDSLAPIHTKAVREYARYLMTRDPELTARLAAAKITYFYDREGALRAMCREWLKLRPPDYELVIVEDLSKFLAESKSTASLTAFSSGFNRLKFYAQSQNLAALQTANPKPPSDPVYAKRLEGFLASKLTHKSRDRRSQIWIVGRNYPDPRICDLAAAALASIWPSRYHYDFAVTDKARDNTVRESLKVFRSRHPIVHRE